MADLDNIFLFVKVAQLESFSKAARALGMPVSTVSRRLALLETQLGVTLLQRTTRRLTLTAQGRAYYNECREPLNHLLDAERVLTQTQRSPEGVLKITVPVILGQEPFLHFLSGFLRSHRRIRIDLFITNVFLDLIAENVDLAIRFGELKDSSVVAKKLGANIRHVVAAPGYLRGRKMPTEPADLAQHDCILLNGKNNEAEWELVRGRKKVRVRVSGTISSRDIHSVSAFTYRGHGIGLLPSPYCEQKIASGELVCLLPEWALPRIPVYAVYATRKFVPSKLQVFLEALDAWQSPFWMRK
jgi:DNA-binding transcriptional LysR family regulator